MWLSPGEGEQLNVNKLPCNRLIANQLLLSFRLERKKALRKIAKHRGDQHDENIGDIGAYHGQQDRKYLDKHIRKQYKGSSGEYIPEKLFAAMDV